jgi:hypothetical protein
MARWTAALTRNRVFRSVIRHGLPDSNRNRSLAVFTNFFLHIHPVKVRLRAIAFGRTFFSSSGGSRRRRSSSSP